MDQATLQRFTEMWNAGVPLVDISDALGLSRDVLAKARAKYGLRKRYGAEPEGGDPDADMIRIRSAEVRTAWDFVTYKLRWQGFPSTHYVD